MSVVFILELSAGITGYVLKGSTYSLVREAFKPTMHFYLNTTHIAAGWDNIQETYKCCGLDESEGNPSYEDWKAIVGGIPLSCCDIPVGHLDYFACNGTQETLHTTGCVQAFGDFIKSHARSLGIVGLALAVIQLFGLLFACIIARQIKKNRGF